MFGDPSVRGTAALVGSPHEPPLCDSHSSWTRVVVASQLASNRIEQIAVAEEAAHRATRRQALAEEIKTPGFARAFKLLRDGPSAKLAFLYHAGKWVLDPIEVGRIIRQEWGAIYQGNVQDRWGHARAFTDKHADLIYTARAEALPPITPEQVRCAFIGSKASAPGPGGWVASGMQQAHHHAFRWLANMYHEIERGALAPKFSLLAPCSLPRLATASLSMTLAC